MVKKMGDRDPSSFYEKLAEMVPAEHYVFMNHGFCESPEHDPAPHKGFHPVHRFSIAFMDFLVKNLDIADKDVLEIGSGRGGNLAYLAQYLGAKSTVGVDLAHRAVTFCQRVHTHPNMSFVQSSADDLPFENSSFDIAVNLESSHSYPDLAKFFSETSRVLRPGGIFLYTDNVFQDRVDSHRRTVENSGFQVVDYQDISKNVTIAMEANHDALEEYYRSMIDPELQNEEFVSKLIKGLNVKVLNMYRNGDAIYGYWRLKKPE